MSQVEWMESAPAAKYPSVPLWHSREKRLYWSDVESCRLYRTDSETFETETLLDDGRPVGAMTECDDGALLLFRDNGEVVMMRRGMLADEPVALSPELKGTRFSCAAVDSLGHIVCAVLSDWHHPARVFFLDECGKFHLLFEVIGIPSGMAFTEDGRTLLMANSYATRAEVLRVGYSAENGVLPSIGPSSVFASFVNDQQRQRGMPGGVACLKDGSIMVARIGGASLVRYTSSGERMCAISLPVKRPVGVCFGGESLENLFVTTAGVHRLVLDGAHAGEVATIRNYTSCGIDLYKAKNISKQ